MKLTPEEKKGLQKAGSLGGNKRWAGKSKEERSEWGRQTIKKRWEMAKNKVEVIPTQTV